MKITINAGHSEVDPGAIGSRGTFEATVCRQIAQLFEQELLKRGHQVQFLQLDELEAVCQQANAYEPELFISLHANAHGNRQAQGAECYYYEESNEGELLAVCLQQALVAGLQLRNRGVKTANFYVLTFTQAPAVLVELAFISNPYEENLLCTKQQGFVQALLTGLEDYLKIKQL